MSEIYMEPPTRETVMIKDLPCGDCFGKHIFIINGMGGCGKDTFISQVELLINTMKISVVDYTKEIAKEIGWEGGKSEKDRKFLSDLKDLIDNYNDMNYLSVAMYTEAFLTEHSAAVLFVTMREKEQILRYAAEYPCKKILVRNDNVKKITSNHADAEVEDPAITYDIFIDNSGTIEDLQHQAVEFVKKYIYNEAI